MTWKIQSRSQRVTSAMKRVGAAHSAMITDEFGQTRHVWMVNGAYRDIPGTVYPMTGNAAE